MMFFALSVRAKCHSRRAFRLGIAMYKIPRGVDGELVVACRSATARSVIRRDRCSSARRLEIHVLQHEAHEGLLSICVRL